MFLAAVARLTRVGAIDSAGADWLWDGPRLSHAENTKRYFPSASAFSITIATSFPSAVEPSGRK